MEEPKIDELKGTFSEEESDIDSEVEEFNETEEQDEEQVDDLDNELENEDIEEEEEEKEEEDEEETEVDEDDLDNESTTINNNISSNIHDIEEDYSSDEEVYEFDSEYKKNIIFKNHPLHKENNMNEIKSLSIITKNYDNFIIDTHHKTLPILTKYEKAKILGLRANQINSGCKPFIEISENDIDGYLIAEKELYKKRNPFIIKRPLPSGENEYWYVNDLEII
jgi:DNA-directed RNA polymerases I, II, and III subunit RPABC2